MTGAESMPTGLKANSALDRFRKNYQSAQKASSGHDLVMALERIKVEKLWEKDLIMLMTLANKLNEVGIQLCVHR